LTTVDAPPSTGVINVKTPGARLFRSSSKKR